MRAANSPVSTAWFVAHLGLCSLAWGSSFLLIKLMHGEVSPLVIAAARGLGGAVTLTLWFLLRGQNPLPRRDELLPWLIIGLLNGFIPNVLVAVGLTQLDSGPAALMQAAGPLITAIGAHWMFADERLKVRSLIGILIGFVGVALLIGPRALEGSATATGVLAMLCVALCYALGNLYTRLIRPKDADRFALGQQSASAVMALTSALVLHGPAGFAPAFDHLGPVLALGIFATALPMAIFMRLITAVGPTRAAITGYTVPTVATILGVVVLGERLTLFQITGAIVVFAGVYIVALSKRKS